VKPQDDSPTRHKILFYLKTKGPQMAARLGERLDVTAMAVRQHLYALEQQGLIDHFDERRKVGRPARHWRLTEAGSSRFPDSHAELSLGIIQAVRATFGEQGMTALLEQRQKTQLAAYQKRMPAASAPIEQKLEALAELRCDEGYMAEWTQDSDGAYSLIENHCPICAAATECQGLCSGELQLFRSLLGDGVAVERTEHILSDNRRCVYRIGAPG